MNLSANANSTFVLTLDFSAWSVLFDLSNCEIRMQMRQGPFLPVIFEWSKANSGVSLSGTNARFKAAVKDVLNFAGNYYFDIRIEAANGAPAVVSSGKIIWSKGVTRTTADESEADTFSAPDTVAVNGEAALPPLGAASLIETYRDTTSIGVGENALQAFSSPGYQCTAFGVDAMTASKTSARTVAIGYRALKSCVAGDASVAIGSQALENYNDIEGGVAVGNQSLQNCTTGLANIGIGNTALLNITSGGLNVTVGHHTIEAGTTAGGNVAMGYQAGKDVTAGAFNTLLGHNTGRGLTTGSNNTIVGGQVTGLSASLSGALIFADGAGTIRLDYNKSVSGYWVAAAPASFGGVQLLGIVVPLTYTVATLPSAAFAGGRAQVSDSNATLAAGLGNIVAGGGGNFVPVYSDGTNWRIG